MKQEERIKWIPISPPVSRWASAPSAPASAWALPSARRWRLSAATRRLSGAIFVPYILGIALAEAIGIYALVISLLLIFV